MNHPLLTKVLGDAFYGSSDPDEHPSRAEVSGLMVDAIPPDIADRLERALDVCQYPVSNRASGLCERTEAGHRGLYGIHRHQPLVTP
jgi:hypothetical protein